MGVQYMDKKIVDSSLAYFRFLNLVQATRSEPKFPKLDLVEERLLNLLAINWHSGENVSVLQAMGLAFGISPTTVHRRLNTLRKKGMIGLLADEVDNRIKYIVATDLSTEYFAVHGQALANAIRE